MIRVYTKAWIQLGHTTLSAKLEDRRSDDRLGLFECGTRARTLKGIPHFSTHDSFSWSRIESNLSFLRSQPLVSLCPIPLFPSTPSPPPQSTSLLSRLFHSICLRYIQFLPYISTAQFILYYAVVSKNKIQLGSVREPGKLSRGSRLSRPPKWPFVHDTVRSPILLNV